jgi:hypothetical protein
MTDASVTTPLLSDQDDHDGEYSSPEGSCHNFFPSTWPSFLSHAYFFDYAWRMSGRTSGTHPGALSFRWSRMRTAANNNNKGIWDTLSVKHP